MSPVRGVLFLIAVSIVVSTAAPAGDVLQPEMVLIPGGEFMMGIEKEGDFGPPHRVRVDSFYIDTYEVTNAQYLEFCEAAEHRLPEFWGIDRYHCGPDYPNHPVIGVSLADAAAYAEWRGVGLPTEAEWEYAARGGLTGAKFAHGDSLHEGAARYYDWKAEAHPTTMPVASYPPNGFGLYDMTGNVCEWVVDRYSEDYYTNSRYENPKGPEKGRFRVIRGGGWHSGPGCQPVHYRAALPGHWIEFNVGFRCVQHLPPPANE